MNSKKQHFGINGAFSGINGKFFLIFELKWVIGTRNKKCAFGNSSELLWRLCNNAFVASRNAIIILRQKSCCKKSSFSTAPFYYLRRFKIRDFLQHTHFCMFTQKTALFVVYIHLVSYTTYKAFLFLVTANMNMFPSTIPSFMQPKL